MRAERPQHPPRGRRKLSGGIGEAVHCSAVDVPEQVAGERSSTGTQLQWMGKGKVVAGGALRELASNGLGDLVGEGDGTDASLALRLTLEATAELSGLLAGGDDLDHRGLPIEQDAASAEPAQLTEP